MPKTLCFILTWIILIAASCLPASAQSPPLDFNGVMTSTTITTGSNGVVSFQAASSSLSTQQNGRQSCYIEYTGAQALAVPTTPQSLGFVFFGPTAPTVTNTSFALTPYQFIYCETEAGGVDNNKVWFASNATSTIFVYKVK